MRATTKTKQINEKNENNTKTNRKKRNCKRNKKQKANISYGEIGRYGTEVVYGFCNITHQHLVHENGKWKT